MTSARRWIRRAATSVTLARVVVIIELLARLGKALAQVRQVLQQHGGACS